MEVLKYLGLERKTMARLAIPQNQITNQGKVIDFTNYTQKAEMPVSGVRWNSPKVTVARDSTPVFIASLQVSRKGEYSLHCSYKNISRIKLT